jgi:hypothetical protein
MAFDLDAAKNHYEEKEIITHYSKKYNFDVNGARKAGYSNAEILEHLSKHKDVTSPGEGVGGVGTQKFALDSIEKAKDYFSDVMKETGPVYDVGITTASGIEGMYATPQARKITRDIAGGVYKHGGQELIDMGGLVGGGIVGSASGPIGTVAGAGLGYAQVKKARETAENMVKKMRGEPVEQGSLQEEAIRSLYDFIGGANLEMGGQIGGNVVGRVINKLAAPSSKGMTESKRLMRDLAESQGIKLSPAAQTESKQFALIESMLEKSPASADIVKDWTFKHQIQPLMSKRAEILSRGDMSSAELDGISRRIHKEVNTYLKKRTALKERGLAELRGRVMARLGFEENPYSLGMSTQEGIAYFTEAAKIKKDALYEKVGDVLPPGSFETPNLNAEAKKLIAEYKNIPEKLPTWLKWSTGELEQSASLTSQLESLPVTVRSQIVEQMKKETPELFSRQLEWKDMQLARTVLGDRARAESLLSSGGAPQLKLQTTPEGRIYYKLKNALEKDMRMVAETHGTEAKEALDLADAFFKRNVKDIARSKIIRKIAFGNPSKVIDIAFTPGGVNEVRILKKALGHKSKAFTELRGGFTKKILGGNEFNPKALKSNLNRYQDYFLREVYSPKELKYLKKVAESGENLMSIALPSDKIIKTVANTYPSTVADAVVGAIEAKPQSHIVYKNIRALKKVLGKDSFQGISDLFASKLFRLNQVSDVLSPVTFAKTIAKYDQRGVLKEFFPYKKIEQLRDLAAVGKRLQFVESVAGNPSGTGQTVMTWGSLGMMFRNPIKGTMIVLTPRLLSKFWFSDIGIKYLTEGFRISSATPKGIDLSMKILSIVNKDKVEE